MNNLQIIAVCTVVSVVLIESLMMNIKLKMATRPKKVQFKRHKLKKGLSTLKQGDVWTLIP